MSNCPLTGDLLLFSADQRLGAARPAALQDMLTMQPMFSTPQLHLAVPPVPHAGPSAVVGVGVANGLPDMPPSQLPPGPTQTIHIQGAGGETILVQHPVLTGLPPPSPHQLPPGPITLQPSPMGKDLVPSLETNVYLNIGASL